MFTNNKAVYLNPESHDAHSNFIYCNVLGWWEEHDANKPVIAYIESIHDYFFNYDSLVLYLPFINNGQKVILYE